MFVPVSNFKISAAKAPADIDRKIARFVLKSMHLPERALLDFFITGKSVDSRRGGPSLVYSLILELDDRTPGAARLERLEPEAVRAMRFPELELPPESVLRHPVVVGTGPGGIFAALALATEPPDPAVMDRKPRRSGDFIVTGTMAKNIFGTAIALVAFFIGWLLHMKGEAGAVLLRDQTVFFSVFVLIQFWNLFNVRAYGTAGSFLRRLGGNHMFYLIAGAILAGQIVIVTFGGRAFRVAPLDVLTWVEIIAATSLVLWIGELIRFVARRLAPK